MKPKLEKMNDDTGVKYEKIVNIIKKKTQKSILYDEINNIINSK